MSNQITPTPWHITSEGIKSESREWYIIGEGEVSSADSAAIVSAINNTYGQQINPESIPEVLRTFKNLIEYFEWLITDLDFPAYREAKAAIEKAKL